MVRTSTLVSVAVVALCLESGGCTQFRQFDRFFLTRCPEDAPRREQEFNVYLEPVKLDEYYRDLTTAAAGISGRVVASLEDKGERLPIYQFGPIGAEDATPILIIAGIHGKEMAGALAAPAILHEIQAMPDDYRGVRLHVVGPANPIGLRYGSRYNLNGCDINRDFREFGTVEARAIRDVLAEVEPRLVLSLHEGPHDGFFVIATRSVPAEVARAASASVPSDLIPLATENNLGWRLKTPGVMREGWFVTGAKTLFAINSLGAYGEEHGMPVLSTEGPWSSQDLEGRVRAQVLAIRGVVRHFTTSRPANKALEPTGLRPFEAR